MRRILLLLGTMLLAFCLAGCRKPITYANPILPDPPFGGVIFVQSAACDNNHSNPCWQTAGQTFQVTLPDNVQDGDSIKVCIYWFAAYFVNNTAVVPATPIVQDSANDSYSLVQTVQNYGSPSKFGYIFSTPSVAAGGTSFQVNVTFPSPPGVQNYTAVVALEYSGGSTLDGQASLGTLGPSPANSGPFTISSDQDVVLSLYFGSVLNTTACNTCNLRFTGSSFIVQDSFPPAAGTYTAQFSNPNQFGLYSVIAAAFQ
jgi:hypothetical protein